MMKFRTTRVINLQNSASEYLDMINQHPKECGIQMYMWGGGSWVGESLQSEVGDWSSWIGLGIPDASNYCRDLAITWMI